MAKSKRGRRKKAPEAVKKHELPGGFWRQIIAVFLIVISIFFVVSWFDGGSPLLVNLKEHMYYAMGLAYYVLPFILTYLAVKIFREADNRLDPAILFSAVILQLLFSGLLGAPGYSEAATGDSGGGVIGDTLNGFVIANLSLGVALFGYIVLIFVTALFMYARTPAELVQNARSVLKSKNEGEDAANARVMRGRAKAKASDEKQPLKLKIRNSTGDGDEKGEKKAPRARGLLAKKAAPAPTAPVKEKEDSALVAISDPDWKTPSLELLDRKRVKADAGDVETNAQIIRETLSQFSIDVEVTGANVGPRITQYTLTPPQGIKVSKIAGYDKELSINLAKDKLRVEAPIPGTRLVGVEVPNARAASVSLHELLRSNEWAKVANDKPLAFTVGKDISGKVIVGNLAKMPHLLIAGTTGSGKSVMTNTLIMSMLYHNSPADLRLIIVDPKQVEMAAYNDIPHLLTPIITQVDKSLSALKWAVNEMENRYSLMAEKRVKNIIDYNALMAKNSEKAALDNAEKPTEDQTEEAENNGKMPYIVVVVDEMADLMMMAGKELEVLIVRIAQKGRAAGIHLVLATQRPEVKVVTGLIKANIPGRIAFAVNNAIDSRVMLDKMGAEKLLGQGDMLYLTTEMMGKPLRAQGAFVSDAEITRVTDFLRKQRAPQYNDEVISQSVQIKGGAGDMAVAATGGGGGGDMLYEAAKIAVENRKISTSLLMRRFSIGYGRAAKMLDELEDMGVVSPPPGGNRPRDVLIGSMDEYPGGGE